MKREIEFFYIKTRTIRIIICLVIIFYFLLYNYGLIFISLFKSNGFSQLGLVNPKNYVLFKKKDSLFVVFNAFNPNQSFYIAKLKKEFSNEKTIKNFCQKNKYPYLKMEIRGIEVFWVKIYRFSNNLEGILWTDVYYIPSKHIEISGFDMSDGQLQIVLKLLGEYHGKIKLVESCMKK